MIKGYPIYGLLADYQRNFEAEKDKAMEHHFNSHMKNVLKWYGVSCRSRKQLKCLYQNHDIILSAKLNRRLYLIDVVHGWD